MDVLNPTIPSCFKIFSAASIFSPNVSTTLWTKKNPLRFNISNSKFFPLHTPFSLCLPLSNSRKFQISAHFGRPTNRRNSLRKKLTDQKQVRHNPIIYDPSSEFQNPVRNFDDIDSFRLNFDNYSGKNNNFNSHSDTVHESKSKPLGESVLWNKLESWVDQYKADSEFWGIGSGPIFTVHQDSDGNVQRVAVNEDEILRRSQIEPTMYEQSELEGLTEVKSKISHAKFLAREMECGDYVLPKNSSVAKIVVSGGQSGFVNAIRGVALQPGLFSTLSRVGITVLCGFFVIWAVTRFFTVGEDKMEYTRLEKEMMRRKVKARMDKEKLVKGSVEVIQVSKEPQTVSTERPWLDKQELMKSIVKAKAPNDELASRESSGTQATKSMDFDNKIQEIRAMSRHARELERRDPLPGDIDGEDDQTENELFNDEEVVQQHGDGGVSFPDDIPDVYCGQIRDLSGTIKPTSFDDPIGDDTGFFSEVSLLENSDTQTSNMKVPNDGESTTQDVKDREYSLSLSDTIEVGGSSDTSYSHSCMPNKNSVQAKPRVILSVKEAREYLSRKRAKPEPNQGLQVRTVQEVDTTLSTESEKETDVNTNQRLDNDDKVCDPDFTLSGMPDFTYAANPSVDNTLKRKESVPAKNNDPEAAEEQYEVLDLQIPRASLGHEGSYEDKGASDSTSSAIASGSSDITSDVIDLQPSILGGTSSSYSTSVEEGYGVIDCQMPGTSLDHDRNSRIPEAVASVNRENWMEKNFHKFEPIFEKIGVGFRDNYMVAREKVNRELNLNPEMVQPKPDEDDGELEWMKDDRLREIVFKVRENELAGRDPFYLMDDEDKFAFFEGLEKKVEKENEKLSNLHEWVHSNIENLDYGADGISLYDPLEKIIPRWKGPPMDKSPEFINNFVEQRKALVAENLRHSYLVKGNGQDTFLKSKDSPSHENILATSVLYHQNTKFQNGELRTPKTAIECSDGSVRAGNKSGKEYWQHTKKWSHEFLESYNAETDPEIKAVMKDMGKDLDRWITEKEIQEAADLMNKVPERGRKFIEEKLNKVKREMELFGPQAVTSKYREYAEEKEEDYLWWLDLPFVLCIELYSKEEGEQKIGFYSLEIAADLELDPKQYHVIAFEDAGDCKNLCYIIQAHMEMLGNGNAFVVAQPPKDAFREAKANGFSVTVIRNGELQLNVDQTLEEVEEQITEIGSKIYHDKIMRERSVDINSLMKGVFGANKPTKRRRSKRKLKKPTKH